MKTFLALALLLLLSGHVSFAADDYVPKQFIPRSVEEALKALPRTFSEVKDWDQFGTMSLVEYQKRGHDKDVGAYDRRVTMIYFAEDANDSAHLDVSIAATQNERSHSGTVTIKKKAAANPDVCYLKTEDVTIGKKSYTAKVYELDTTTPYGGDGGELQTRNLLWIVPGIPHGIAKSEAFQVESVEQEKPSLHFTFRLVDLDVRIDAAGRKFACYCTERETLWPDGEREFAREWKSAAVPGGVVRSNLRTTRNGVEEVADDTELVDLEVVRPVPPAEAERNLQLGEARGLLQMGDAQGSIAAFDRLLASGEDFPGRAGAYNDRGWAKWTAGDHDGALADYDLAIRLEPSLPDPYNNRAFAKLAGQDFSGALKDFNRAIDRNPRFARAIAGRAIAYMRLHKDTLALEDYQTVITNWPSLKKSLDEEIEKARQARK
jgi:tetratricopeptide (TPR) repeat protein